MKLTSYVKVSLALALVSVILSVGIFRINTYKSVAPCFNTPVCQSTLTGKLKVVRYGFPSVYRQTANYKPDASNTFANASVEQQGLSWIYVVTNGIFWFALLNGAYTLFVKATRKPGVQTPLPASPTPTAPDNN